MWAEHLQGRKIDVEGLESEEKRDLERWVEVAERLTGARPMG